MIPTSVGFQCPDDVREGARSVRPARTAFGGRRTDGAASVTRVLLVLNVLVFVVTALTGTSLGLSGGSSPLYDYLALQPVPLDFGGSTGVVPGVADGQWWRLVTSTFLHFGLLHILFNLMALAQVGPLLESALGRVRFLALYLLSGLTGSTAVYVLGEEVQRTAGASGAIFGLFAAAYVVERRRGSAAAGSYAALLGINILLTFAIPNISILGHLGGLVGGALAALALVAAPRGPRRGLVQALGMSVLAVLLVAAVVARTAQLA